MELKSHILLPTTTALFVFSCFAAATFASDHREEDKQLRTIELSTHSLSVSWRNFDERARSFIATIHPIDSGENTLVTQRVDAIKTCLLVYINESFATWTDLVPGKTYTVSVVSVNAIEEISTYEQRDVTTKPMPPASLTAEPFVTSNADEFGLEMEMLEHVPTYGLYVDWKNPVIGLFDHFMVAIYPPHGKIKRRVYYENEFLHQESEEESGLPLRVRRYLDNSLDRIIWDLVPGVHYDILVTSESNGVQSDSASVGRRMPPETPGPVKADSLTETQVLLSWEGPHRGIIDDFRIYLTPQLGSVVNPTDRTIKTRMIRMLTPGTKYDAEVFSLSNDTQSMEASAVTFITPPLEPTDLRTPQIESKFIDLYWPKPEGHIDFYHVVYYPEEDPSAEEGQMKVTTNSLRLDDLKEDTEYYIRVSSVSNGVYSAPVSVTNRTKPSPAPAKVRAMPGGIEGENSTGAHVECTSNEILLYLDKTRFGTYETEYGPLHFGNGSDPNCYAEKSFSKEESYYLYRIGPNLSSCNTDSVRNQTHVNLTNILNNDKRRNEWLKKVTDSSRTVIFGNKLMSAENNGKVVSRFSMRIWCTYPTNYTVQTSYDNVELEMLVLRWSVRGKGEFAARMRLFQSELFEVPYRFAPKLNMSDNIYAEIELLDQAVKGTKVVVKKCWATPTENQDYRVKYTIIEEGCPIKETMNNQLVIYENGKQRHVRWQGPVFGFIDEKQVWLHCSIQVCFDLECVPDCSFEGKRRRKRDNPLETHVISTGPIRSVKKITGGRPEVKVDLPEVDNRQPTGKSNSLIVAAIIVLLLIIIASCSVISGLGWRMRRSIPSKKLSFSNKSIFPPTSDLACIPVPALADRSLFPSSLSSTSVTTEFGKEDPEPTTTTTGAADAPKDVADQEEEEEEGDVEKL